jgi:hypothetical protein
MIRDVPLSKPDRNKSILRGAAKWPYPLSFFDLPSEETYLRKFLIGDVMRDLSTNNSLQ